MYMFNFMIPAQPRPIVSVDFMEVCAAAAHYFCYLLMDCNFKTGLLNVSLSNCKAECNAYATHFLHPRSLQIRLVEGALMTNSRPPRLHSTGAGRWA